MTFYYTYISYIILYLKHNTYNIHITIILWLYNYYIIIKIYFMILCNILEYIINYNNSKLYYDYYNMWFILICPKNQNIALPHLLPYPLFPWYPPFFSPCSFNAAFPPTSPFFWIETERELKSTIATEHLLNSMLRASVWIQHWHFSAVLFCCQLLPNCCKVRTCWASISLGAIH